MKKVLLFLLFLFFLYCGGALFLYLFQERLIFKRAYAKPYRPAYAKAVTFKTSDGVVLEGGIIEHNKTLPKVLYFGGNASNVLIFLDKTAQKIKEYNFIAFNYPGYGNSQGSPSQKKILKYALEITKRYKPDLIIGRSLGTAVASYVSTQYKVKTLLLITPFDSIESIAKNRYPIFPISLLLKHKFPELEYLKRSKAGCINALFVKHDEVIPKEDIQKVKRSIAFNKVMTIEAGHDLIYNYKNIDRVIAALLECK